MSLSYNTIVFWLDHLNRLLFANTIFCYIEFHWNIFVDTVKVKQTLVEFYKLESEEL